ncbi:hypothetical protein LSAT2_005885 [Lamellibrachia satsuma]|nr:hypothetical protein LSAT2_005885 [Lamellibrachia satsuma]
MNGVFCFKVKKDSDEAVWVVDMKNGSGSVRIDPSGKGDVTITMDDDGLVKLMLGQLNPEQIMTSFHTNTRTHSLSHSKVERVTRRREPFRIDASMYRLLELVHGGSKDDYD